jgi:hypothetical protein
VADGGGESLCALTGSDQVLDDSADMGEAAIAEW